jgi:hypothetical protein
VLVFDNPLRIGRARPAEDGKERQPNDKAQQRPADL